MDAYWKGILRAEDPPRAVPEDQAPCCGSCGFQMSIRLDKDKGRKGGWRCNRQACRGKVEEAQCGAREAEAQRRITFLEGQRDEALQHNAFLDNQVKAADGQNAKMADHIRQLEAEVAANLQARDECMAIDVSQQLQQQLQEAKAESEDLQKALHQQQHLVVIGGITFNSGDVSELLRQRLALLQYHRHRKVGDHGPSYVDPVTGPTWLRFMPSADPHFVAMRTVEGKRERPAPGPATPSKKPRLM